ncbi:MAG: hypothetical protein RL660_1263 [Bacteroidota bacterium]|jgi:hypothetical protein
MKRKVLMMVGLICGLVFLSTMADAQNRGGRGRGRGRGCSARVVVVGHPNKVVVRPGGGRSCRSRGAGPWVRRGRTVIVTTPCRRHWR